MKERPILFRGEMVRAILEGRKTMTRRIVKPQPAVQITGPVVTWLTPKAMHSCLWREGRGEGITAMCPYGQPGDRLWVKETWGDGDENNTEHGVYYRATDPAWDSENTGFRWKPSLFMPRWASRITPEIVSVMAERLQEISGDDALSEGVPCSSWSEDDWVDSDGYPTPKSERHERAIEEFAALWDSINSKPKPVRRKNGKVSYYISYPFAGTCETRTYRGKPWIVSPNPWVWVIEFERVKP